MLVSMHSSERLRVAVTSLILTWLFFVEHIPPFKKVQFWSDIGGYHQPLLFYAHQSLREGRIPLWDPSIYCGIPFAGNINASLFYPPNWAFFALHAGLNWIPFQSIEIFAILHIWLAFFLSYLWLRDRSNHWMPAVLGAGVIAYGGYILGQLNHLGVCCAYAWMPLGLWGIDQAGRERRWQPLWKLAAGSALVILSGYPPAWVAFATIATAFAIALPGHFRLALQTLLGLMYSLLVAAAVLLPTMEAAKLKIPEVSFGGGISQAPGIWLSYFLPNYYDYNRHSAGPDPVYGAYLYLGAPALFAILYFLRRPAMKGALPAFAIAGAALWVMINPFALLDRVILHVPLAGDVVRQFNYLLGPSIGAGLLTASALDTFLSQPTTWSVPRGRDTIWIVASFLWCVWLLFLWPRSGIDFPVGLASALYAFTILCLFFLGLGLYRAAPSTPVAFVLLMAVFIDYKAFGTNRTFIAQTGKSDEFFRGDRRAGGASFNGLSDSIYRTLLAEPEYRLALVTAPHTTDMRFYGLATAQGFDPFLPAQYRDKVEQFVKFSTNRLFEMDPANLPFLESFGVKYVMVQNGTTPAANLVEHPSYRRLEPSNSYFQVFEYINAKPAWRFEGKVKVDRWKPEERIFTIDSQSGGTFALLEQYFPGWYVAIDGREAELKHWDKTFQSVSVPAGPHRVEFVYRPVSVRLGVLISLLSTALVALVAFRYNHKHPTA